VPPDAPSRTSTPAEVATLEDSKKANGAKPKKPKKMSEEERLEIFTELNEKRGFTIKEIDQLIKDGAHADAIAGKITPGMMRQPQPAARTVAPDPDTVKIGTNSLPTETTVQEIGAAPAEIEALKQRGYTLSEIEEIVTAGVVADALADVPAVDPAADPAAELRSLLADRGAKADPVPALRLTIFVDCVPTKRDGAAPVHLDDWVAPIGRIVAEASGKADWRQIPYTSRGDLAVGIRTALASCPTVLVALSRSSVFDVAMEILRPHAELIVEGVGR